MRLFALVTLIMCAFAANSVLNRIGVALQGMDPMDFATVRTGAGAAMLWVLVMTRAAPRPAVISAKRFAGATALAVYMVGFSWAYITLDAGFGALILFGVLQIVIFGWAVIEGGNIPVLRWIGAAIALLGLCVLLWPSGDAPAPLNGAVSMTIAGAAWAVYTLLGRTEADPLGATASNFLLCLPLVAIAMIWGGIGAMPLPGVMTAIIAGAITSGLGYALWYRALPALPTTIAGITQLSVPVIAVTAGVLFLSEPLTLRLIIAGGLVLGGIAVSLTARR
ncbi:EamA-like transporter family protein [Yoonia maricola]|uniref:EamA-like transporter family protein n=1 Tax=Yoonia maricola TaxID=420999 RepID=A0A2M8WPQ5_9RHOB|nr:DMT family transporter [Yoonia maricola]PJI92816.1 EamA-like transporter family protein [Yoonia maricola]